MQLEIIKIYLASGGNKGGAKRRALQAAAESWSLQARGFIFGDKYVISLSVIKVVRSMHVQVDFRIIIQLLLSEVRRSNRNESALMMDSFEQVRLSDQPLAIYYVHRHVTTEWPCGQIGAQLEGFVKSGNVSEAFKLAAAMANLPGLAANLTLNTSSWTRPYTFSYMPSPPTPAPSVHTSGSNTSALDEGPGRRGRIPPISSRLILVIIGVLAGLVAISVTLVCRIKRPHKLKVMPSCGRTKD